MLPQHFIPISDSPFSKIKRAITWSNFSVNKDDKSVSMNTSCHFFNSDPKEPDGYGPEMTNQEVRSFTRFLVANNNTLVNPATGLHAVLVVDSPEVRNTDGTIKDYQVSHYEDSLGNIVQSPIGQFDYFFGIIMNTEIKVLPLIIQILQTEDQVYHTYDK